MSKVIIIGGGASGLIAAIFAKNANNEVIILEKNSVCGKKLLITGNGRCNYFNSDQELKHYHTNSNIDLKTVINAENLETIEDFFSSIGIIPKIKNGYYYPLSNQATSIANALVLQAKLLGIEIKNNITVTDIIATDNKFLIKTDYEDYECDKLIIAAGSKAAPKTGSDGFGYKLLEKMGHKIIKPLPALVQLKSNDKITSLWDGVRSDVTASLYINDKKTKEETGEVMLTDYGVSGICIFNLSGKAARALEENKNVSIKINFLPNINVDINWLENYNAKVADRTISELLDCLLNYKLVNALLKKLKIDNDSKLDDLTKSKKEELVKALTDFEIKIIGTNSFDKAQVCSGGVSLEEINLTTMESNIIPKLYLSGELLDVDGDCGGYNLTWAWISGMLAGKGASSDD